MSAWLKRNGGFLACAMIVALGASVFAACYPLLATDTLCRYAPMAEAFAAGEWREAFHPRFGIGLSVGAGLLTRFSSLEGLASTAAVATFAWALGVIPIFGLARQVFDRTTAWFAAALYVISPTMVMWGLKGLREPFKALGFLLLADAIFRVRKTRGWAAYVEASLGAACLLLFKADAVLLAGAMGLVWAIQDRFRVRTWAFVVTAILILQPMCALTYQWTGWWLPASQYVVAFEKLFGG